MKFFSLTDSQLKRLCPTDPKLVTFINLPENSEKTILINSDSFHIGKGTYLSMQMQEEEIKISMSNGVFSKQSTIRLVQNGGRYFLIDANKHLNIGQSNKVLTLGLVEVSQVVGEIMQHYLQKNRE